MLNLCFVLLVSTKEVDWSCLSRLAVLADQSRDSDRGVRLVGDHAAPKLSDKVLTNSLSSAGYVNRVG